MNLNDYANLEATISKLELQIAELKKLSITQPELFYCTGDIITNERTGHKQIVLDWRKLTDTKAARSYLLTVANL
jgi:hypothetical protein